MLSLKYQIVKALIKKISKVNVEYLGEKTNLKLYDLNEFICDNEEYFSFDEFNMFCVERYETFKEYLDENYLELKYIGRTSSFYVGTKWLYEYYDKNSYDNESIMKKKMMVIEEFLYHEYNICIANEFYSMFTAIKQKLSDIDNEIRESFDNLSDNEIIEEIVNQFKENYLDDLDSIKQCYDYIIDFKANSIRIFTEEYEDIA